MRVNKRQLADILGCSPRNLDKHIKDGLPCLSGGGKGKPREFDSSECIKWLIDREIEKRCGGSMPEAGSMADEDRLLKRARRQKLQIEIDQKRGQIASIEMFEDLAFVIAGVYGSQLDSLAPRVAGKLAAIDTPAEIISQLHDETRRIRNATASQLLEQVSKLGEKIAALFDQESDGDVEGSEAEIAE